jgi:hypothetical protein
MPSTPVLVTVTRSPETWYFAGSDAAIWPA